MSRNVYCFDLDATTINSDHRVKPCMMPNGDLNLQRYIDVACTHDKVMKDTLLPLASYMKALIAKGETVVIVTARYMNQPDYYFLRKQGLSKGVIVCSRDRLSGVFGKDEAKIITKLSDGEYKRYWFNHLWHTLPNSTFTMFDDHQGVLEVAQQVGFTAYDAIIINEMLNTAFADGVVEGEDYSETMFNSMLDDLSLPLSI